MALLRRRGGHADAQEGTHGRRDLARVAGGGGRETGVAVCRKYGISQQTLYLWKLKYAGLGPSDLRELRQLREENSKLKRLVAAVSAAHPVSERRATSLLGFGRCTVRYQPRRDRQEALRLRELAGSRIRFRYRRLTVLLRREGWLVNAKRIYRLYMEEGLIVRTTPRKRAAQRHRHPQTPVSAPNQRWAMDFVHERLVDGRWFRVLTVLDQATRECLRLWADVAMTGQKVAAALDPIIQYRGAPEAITVDNGSEFASRALEVWAYQHGIQLDFIRPGKPVENSYIESLNGRLRDECLNVELFFSLQDAREKLEIWRQDYNHYRPHSALWDRTPAEVAAT